MEKRERADSLITNNKVIADVSEDSRNNGRQDVGALAQGYRKTYDQLRARKIKLEGQLSEIEYWKKQETHKIIVQELPRTESIKATSRLEAQVHEKKISLKKEIKEIQGNMIPLKRKIHEALPQKEKSHDCLLRIERILANILREMERRND